MESKRKKRHSGLDLLRLALGEALPEKSRKGALMPKHMAPLAGVNYQTVRQLLNGARDFESDTRFNQLMADNLAITTGVHPSFRTTREPIIRDLWGEPFTGASYHRWVRLGISNSIFRPGRKSGKKRREKNVSLAARMREQSLALHALLYEIAVLVGTESQSMAFALINDSLIEVAKLINVLPDLSNHPNLCRFRVTMHDASLLHRDLTFAEYEELPWNPNEPALSVAGERCKDIRAAKRIMDHYGRTVLRPGNGNGIPITDGGRVPGRKKSPRR